MEQTFIWLAFIVGVLSSAGAMWKDWKNSSESEYKASNRKAVVLFALACGSIILTSVTGYISINKQKQSDSIARYKDSINQGLTDSLVKSQKKLINSQTELNRLAINQLDTLRSIAYLSEKLNETQTDLINSQNEIKQGVVGDTGFCYLDMYPVGMMDSCRGILKNPNKHSIYNITIWITDYDKMEMCKIHSLPSGNNLMNLSCFMKCTHEIKVDEIGANQTLMLDWRVPSGVKLNNNTPKYEISYRTRATRYKQQIVYDNFGGDYYAKSRLYVLQGSKYQEVKRINEFKSAKISKVNWSKYFNTPKVNELIDIGDMPFTPK